MQSNDWVEKGNQLLDQHKDEAALDAFDKAVQIDPNNPEIWFPRDKKELKRHRKYYS